MVTGCYSLRGHSSWINFVGFIYHAMAGGYQESVVTKTARVWGFACDDSRCAFCTVIKAPVFSVWLADRPMVEGSLRRLAGK